MQVLIALWFAGPWFREEIMRHAVHGVALALAETLQVCQSADAIIRAVHDTAGCSCHLPSAMPIKTSSTSRRVVQDLHRLLASPMHRTDSSRKCCCPNDVRPSVGV